jgi:hypothetical protein
VLLAGDDLAGAAALDGKGRPEGLINKEASIGIGYRGTPKGPMLRVIRGLMWLRRSFSDLKEPRVSRDFSSSDQT